jgi:hypothetical protein
MVLVVVRGDRSLVLGYSEPPPIPTSASISLLTPSKQRLGGLLSGIASQACHGASGHADTGFAPTPEQCARQSAGPCVDTQAAQGIHPALLAKSGGGAGFTSYIAAGPRHGRVVNRVDFAMFSGLTEAASSLIATLATRQRKSRFSKSRFSARRAERHSTRNCGLRCRRCSR